MALGGTEAIGSLSRSKYIYHDDAGNVCYISMRDVYAAENSMVKVGASGAPSPTGGKFLGKPRHVWLLAPAGTVTNVANKPVRRKMPFDPTTSPYLSGKAPGTLTGTAIDGITFQLEGHVGEKTHA